MIVILFLILTDLFIYFVLDLLWHPPPHPPGSYLVFCIPSSVWVPSLFCSFTFMILYSPFWLFSSDFIQSFLIYLNFNQFPYFLQMTTSVLLKAQHLATSSPREGHRDPEVNGVEAEVEDRNQIIGKATPQTFFYSLLESSFSDKSTLELKNIEHTCSVLGDEIGGIVYLFIFMCSLKEKSLLSIKWNCLPIKCWVGNSRLSKQVFSNV